MAVENIQTRVRRKLEEVFGVEEATYLMDRPPGGWSDLVTKDYLDARLDALRAEMRAEIATVRAEMAALSASVDRRLRAQTWITTGTMVAGLTLAFTAGRLA